MLCCLLLKLASADMTWFGYVKCNDLQQQSFSGRRLTSLEQFATPRHVCTVTACFLQSSEDLSLQTQFSLTIQLCPRSDTCHYGHINRSYLLTYLKLSCQMLYNEKCVVGWSYRGHNNMLSMTNRRRSTTVTSVGWTSSQTHV